MSYINEIEFDFEIGDSYEMSPIEMTYLVGKVKALGGEVSIDGDIVTITSMPGKEFKPEPKPEPKVTWFAPETPVETTPEVTPEPEKAKEVKEATAEVKQPPTKRAPKAKSEETKEEESKPEVAKEEEASKPEEAKKSDPTPAPVEE